MSKGRQLYHAMATGFMCVILTALILLGGRFLAPIGEMQTNVSLMAGAIIFEVFAIVGIILQIRDYCRIVRQYTYDGRAFRYETLASSVERVRSITEIADISQGRGRAPSMGYAITFQGGKKVYLDYTLPNAREAAERLRLDLAEPI